MPECLPGRNGGYGHHDVRLQHEHSLDLRLPRPQRDQEAGAQAVTCPDCERLTARAEKAERETLAKARGAPTAEALEQTLALEEAALSLESIARAGGRDLDARSRARVVRTIDAVRAALEPKP